MFLPQNYFTLFWIPIHKKPFKNKCVREEFELIFKDPGFFDKNIEVLLHIKKTDENTFKSFLSRYNSPIENVETLEIFEFKNVNHNQFGFVEFSIFFNQKIAASYDFEKVWNSLSIQIYRVIKSIFHFHKYHLSNDYFIDEPLPFSKQNILNDENETNLYYNFYFNYITCKVNDYRIFLLSKVEDKFTLENQFGFFKFKMNHLLYIRKYVDNVTGVLSYLDNLREIDHFAFGKITNYAVDIHRIRREVIDTYSAKRSNASVLLGYTGLFIGLVSFGLSVFWSSQASRDQLRIENKIDSNIRNCELLFKENSNAQEKHYDNRLLVNTISSKIDESQNISRQKLNQIKDQIQNLSIDSIYYTDKKLTFIFKEPVQSP